MIKNWTIYCPHCGDTTTIGHSPKQREFQKTVPCSLCGEEIDATVGAWDTFSPSRKPILEPNYLEV